MVRAAARIEPVRECGEAGMALFGTSVSIRQARRIGRLGLRMLLCWLPLLPLLLLDVFPFAAMLETILRPLWAGTGGAFWERAATAWRETGFGPALANSVYVALLSSTLSTVVAIPAAYALSRYRFRLRRTVGDLLLSTQLLSPVILVLGLSQLIAWTHLSDSPTGLALIYAAFQTAFAVWLLRSYFDEIPPSIEEAARLDGASTACTLAYIILPLSTPAIVVTAIFSFISAWNEFAVALTLLRNPRHYTLPVQIYALVAGRYEVDWQSVMLAVLAASLPVVALFGLLQRHLLRGLAAQSWQD